MLLRSAVRSFGSGGALPTESATNQLTISETDGVATTNYPIQIGRPFPRGVIFDYPTVKIDGVSAVTQADVKQRWPDTSVKHSVISFLIPTMQASVSKTITFANNPSNSNVALTQAQMLASNFDFDATITLSSGVTILGTASARQMLADGNFTYWCSGQVATTIILCDHSVAKLYDMGTDASKSFRPIFHATFWPTINKVHVRFIGECSNSEAFQNQNYDLTLTTGHTTPSTVYSKNTIVHYAGSRWTKVFWIGGAPSTTAVNNNLKYLTTNSFLPNWDTTITIPETTIQSEYAAWLANDRDLFDAGDLQKDMGTVGGREDIGPLPTWHLRWLYTGDKRMAEQAFGNADLAAAWGMHFRECDPAKRLDRALSIQGLGQPISISDRKTLQTTFLTRSNTLAADKINIVGIVTAGGWIIDNAHVPDFYSSLYMTTGDYWYLEQSKFWSSYLAGYLAGTATTSPNGRGPTGAECSLESIQVRATAWVMNAIANAGYWCPDSDPFKAYLSQLTDDSISAAEGARGITGTTFENNAVWTWASNTARNGSYILFGTLANAMGFSPLNFWLAQDDLHPGTDTDPTSAAVAEYGISPWEVGFLLVTLGWMRDRGYKTSALITWIATFVTGMMTDSSFNPYLSGMYKMPATKLSNHSWFTTWADCLTGYDPNPWTGSPTASHYRLATAQTDVTREVNDGTNAEGAWMFIMLAAVSNITAETNGTAAYNFANNFVRGQNLAVASLTRCPKWLMLPR